MAPERKTITENDMYSDKPERRKSYWLQNATFEVDRFLGFIRKDLTVLPQNSKKKLKTGELGNDVSYFTAIPQAVPTLYKEKVAGLINEINSIAHEKGFRFQPALLTSREHQKIGSSGYEGIFWETDPDVPTPILRKRLITEGKLNQDKSETYTVGEIDCARRLSGMTRLDLATGRVTDEIDKEAANDSYYFLLPERRAEVIQRESEILTEIDKITKSALEIHETSRKILPSLELYVDGKLTTPDLQTQYASIVERNTEKHSLSLASQIRELKRLAVETGKWDHILTPQEIMLRAGATVDKKYLSRPYTPLAIQDCRNIEEIAHSRQGEKSMIINTALLKYEMPFGFRLEELDVEGNTIKSPTFLSKDDGETLSEDDRFREYFGPKIKFPFARPSDWFYKETKI